MAQIKINISDLEKQTELLNALYRSFCGQETVIPGISGSGPVASRTQELSEMLLRVRESLKNLFEDTLKFLNTAKSSYINTDTQIAQAYEK